jgi:hypothetical protein
MRAICKEKFSAQRTGLLEGCIPSRSNSPVVYRVVERRSSVFGTTRMKSRIAARLLPPFLGPEELNTLV